MSVHSLNRLIELREREVERLNVEVANKRAVGDRYRRSLERMTALCEGSGASAALPPALSLNCGNYKQAMLGMVDLHRQDLALHEADMAVSQRALDAAARKQEVFQQLLARRQAQLLREHESREQKRQDELATQVWWRGQR
ncbi:flagellar export protein FliJ [Caldimonas brevitalea]|uniref:Flagellar FliJ protein n=1 Tax=Caldimonas brevitalea TaxID=413882 RepID=A0A0G3BSK9_9BURK|nr:flagellar export protein FliJ [Caldimonas brevitalea]AKJ30366.1 flagellar export protein FliJ [Caldimonas brevitalea]